MLNALLKSTRRLNKILQSSGPEGVLFSDLTKVLMEVLSCNVYVVSRKGRILGAGQTGRESTIPVERVEPDTDRLTEEYNGKLLQILETAANIKPENMPSSANAENTGAKVFLTVVPVSCIGERLGTLIFESFDREFNESDLILAEYGATVVGMEIVRAKTVEIEEEARKKAVVQMAIGTLSYSELEAVEHIFRELDGHEGLLVASKIADRVGITRSVIVNALRKFESAGVIESRSLGMKGTHIKILNDKLLPELEKLK